MPESARNRSLSALTSATDPLVAAARNLGLSVTPILGYSDLNQDLWLLATTALTLGIGVAVSLTAEPILGLAPGVSLRLPLARYLLMAGVLLGSSTTVGLYALTVVGYSVERAALVGLICFSVPVCDTSRMLYHRVKRPGRALIISLLSASIVVATPLWASNPRLWLYFSALALLALAVGALASSVTETKRQSRPQSADGTVMAWDESAIRSFVEYIMTAGLGLIIILIAARVLTQPVVGEVRLWQLLWMPIGLVAMASRVLVHQFDDLATFRRLASLGVLTTGVAYAAIVYALIVHWQGWFMWTTVSELMFIQAMLAGLAVPSAFLVRRGARRRVFLACRAAVLVVSVVCATMGLVLGTGSAVAGGLAATSLASGGVWVYASRIVVKEWSN